MLPELLLPTLTGALTVWMTSRVFGLFRVQGESMLPNLLEKDWVLARRYFSWEMPRAGEVIILQREQYPQILIKRILSEPGEILPAEICMTESRLPEDRYFLESDNREVHPTARWVGPVEREQIWGKAWLIVGPWQRLRFIK